MIFIANSKAPFVGSFVKWSLSCESKSFTRRILQNGIALGLGRFRDQLRSGIIVCTKRCHKSFVLLQKTKRFLVFSAVVSLEWFAIRRSKPFYLRLKGSLGPRYGLILYKTSKEPQIYGQIDLSFQRAKDNWAFEIIFTAFHGERRLIIDYVVYASSCFCRAKVLKRKWWNNQALASPSLISLTSSDPILTAFQLSNELKKLGRMESQFSADYTTLRSQVRHTISSPQFNVLPDFGLASKNHESICCNDPFS